MVFGNWRIGAVVVAFIFTTPSVLAATSPQTTREKFIQAEKQMASAPLAKAQQLLKGLDGYPLRPYLELEVISRDLKDTAKVQAFLQLHAGSPMAWSLKKRWLMYLANQGQAKTFLSHYQQGQDTELDCAAMELRLKHESPAKVWADVSQLWLNGEGSLPKSCDDLFRHWQKAGQRKPEIVWARMVKVAKSGETRLLPYLRSLLPAKQQYLGDKWKQVIENPALVTRSKFLPLQHPWEREIVVYGLKKLVWKQPEKALAVWTRFEQDPHFSKAQRIDVARDFAIALASKQDARAPKFLAMVPTALKDDLFIQWQVNWHLRRQDFPQVLAVLDALPADAKADASWRYWRARALAATGQTQQSQQLWQALANERSYYGFMAAARLGQKPQLSHKPIPVSKEQYGEFKRSPAIARMNEWNALKRPNAARRELNFIQKYGSEQQKLSSARLAFDNGWYDRAVFMLADAGYWDDIEIRFPMAYKAEIQRHARAANVDPAWAMAITRRESVFMPEVKSAVGAHGLMQIMPQTAKHIKGKRVAPAQLLNPGLNIDMGTDYLSYLMRTNNNNLALATASYNAGYGNVKKWLPSSPMDLDVWIETIPFKETREYVKAVLAYYQIYNIRLDQPQDVFVPLVTMQVNPAR